MKKGDLVHLNWTPSSGTEMSRPHYGVVISSNNFNSNVYRLIVAPITSKKRPDFGPLRIKITVEKSKSKKAGVKGYICLDHLRSIDPEARQLKPTEQRLSKKCLDECSYVLKKIFAL